MDESIDFDDNASVVSPFESIKVVVRVRPLNLTEGTSPTENNSSLTITSPTTLSVTTNDHRKGFQCGFDHVLGPTTTQAQVYDVLKECTHSVFQGVNSTIFAYGQTGSGKTHSMYGPPNYITKQTRETEQLGIIPRVIHHIFELAKHPNILQLQVHCSFVQIYNENLYDMLRDPSMNTPLTIREDKEQKEIFVQGLSEYHVQNVHDTLHLLTLAEEHRVIRETHMNQASSRSHSIFQIFVEQKRMVMEESDGMGGSGMQGEVGYKAKFNLVDLAGSEKWDINSNDLKKSRLSSEHIQEMNNINLSLHTLGKCISSLAKMSRKKQKEQHKLSQSSTSLVMSEDETSLTTSSRLTTANSSSSNVHIPYRESKLTRLLQDSLGGNAKTFLLATLSASKDNLDETISTLKFADRAKQVMITVRTNEIRPYDHLLVQRLQSEVSLWKTVWRKICSTASLPLQQVCHTIEQEKGKLFIEQESIHWSNCFLPAVYNNSNNGSSNGSSNAVQTVTVTVPLSITTTLDTHNNSSKEEEESPLLGSHLLIPPPLSTTKIIPSSSTSPLKSSNKHSSKKQGNTIDPESSLAYVITLEKTLNQEQINNQHLLNKNETLIKEIEFLKTRDLQNTLLSPSTITPKGTNGTNGIVWSPSMIQTLQYHLNTIDTFTSHSQTLQKTLEELHNVMKMFFKYQIEEEEMKEQVMRVLGSVIGKEEKKKEVELVEKMKEGKVWLTALIPTDTNSNNSSSNNSNVMPIILSRQQQLLQQSQSLLSTSNTNNNNNTHYNNSCNSSNSTSNSNSNVQQYPYPSQLSPLHPHNHSHNHSHNHHNNTQLSSSSLSNKKPKPTSATSTTSTTSHTMALTPAHHSELYDINSTNHSSHTSSKKSLHTTNTNTTTNNTNTNTEPPPSSSLSPAGGITYRVRGVGANAATNTNTNSNIEGGGSVWSSVDNLHTFLQQTDETEEEHLRQEYQASLLKQKKRDKLQAWMKRKESKQQQELAAQEEEKKAMEEAEYQRELKRKEYAQKQKLKLSSYQEKLKQETEKIQELINLGIDPASLNL